MRILAISYSQTGQLDKIINNFICQLNEFDIDRIQYKPEIEFTFPWTMNSFFEAMPESILETPFPLQPISFKYEKYDLIILGYQPWYLSPSIPTNSLLQSTEFLKRVKDTPIITIIGSRNMWINSQNSVKNRIENAGGKIIGNIPFVDRNQNQVSAVTILHWMLTGKKTKKYGIFPRPGISDKDIASAEIFGKILQASIVNNNLNTIQNSFLSTNLISLPTDILFIEERAKRLFSIWAKLITKYGKSPKGRTRLLTAFKYYLIIALFIVAPIVIFIFKILILPFVSASINKKKQIYLQ